MIKSYDNVKFSTSSIHNDIVLTFWFSFDDWSSDRCIVYDIDKPKRWACDCSYKVTAAATIQKLINKLIRQHKKDQQ